MFTDSNDREAMLLEVLEAVYWDTVIPVGKELRDAGVDLLSLETDSAAASYWEHHPEYSPLTSQR
jgi:hypothetical protein